MHISHPHRGNTSLRRDNSSSFSCPPGLTPQARFWKKSMRIYKARGNLSFHQSPMDRKRTDQGFSQTLRQPCSISHVATVPASCETGWENCVCVCVPSTSFGGTDQLWEGHVRETASRATVSWVFSFFSVWHQRTKPAGE